jgi:tRNA threonylcarbamoyladenosine biosynthesis protein TsaB
MARDLPSVGVTSLLALAYPQRRRNGLVAAVVDARRSEVYWSLFRSDGKALEQLRPPAVATPAGVAAELTGLGEVPLCVGDGACRYGELFAGAGAEVAGPADMWPSPLVIAELGAESLGLGAADGAGAVLSRELPVPLYLRQADVRIGWDQLGGRVGPPTRTSAG